jgi:hypothetical protein
MKYNPPLDTPVNMVELVNKVGLFLEEELPKNILVTPTYKYVAVDSDGEVWMFRCKPMLHKIVWCMYEQCKCLYTIRLPRRIEKEINKDTFKYLLFELGAKDDLKAD